MLWYRGKEKRMSRKVGLWIDHKNAIIVTLKSEKATTKIIECDIERHVHPSGGSRSSTPYGPQDVVSESKWEGRYKHHFDRYYSDVIDFIRDAGEILIFGPASAKEELKKAIDKNKALAACIVGVEPADKMTKNQIVAKVRKHFQNSGTA